MSTIKKLFGIGFHTKLNNEESGESIEVSDPIHCSMTILHQAFLFSSTLLCIMAQQLNMISNDIQESSSSYMLKCNISIDVNHLGEGIQLGLKDDREKRSEKLGRY